MKYAHIIAAVTEERWAIQRSKLQLMLDLLADQAAGTKFDADKRQARIGSRPGSGEGQQRQGAVAILPLRGVIANRMNLMSEISGGTSSEQFGAIFDAMMANDAVKAIIFDVDSPGGAVSGTAELAAKIFAARGRKPIIAHVNATCASAAYWIASAADEIVVTPTGVVGSIGVLAVHEDVSGALEKAGIRKTIISAGELKAEGNPYEALGNEARGRIQARIDSAYGMFVGDVAKHRRVSEARVRDGFGRGDTVDARAAVAEGMADRVGTLEETLARLGASNFAPASRPAPARQQRAASLARWDRIEALRWSMAGDDEILALRGVATLFNDIGMLDEPTVFQPGCFRLADSPKLLREHDPKRTLAPAGRVRLAKGEGAWLNFECALRPDAFGLLTLEAMAEGLDRASVGYRPISQHHRLIGRRRVRIVEAAGLPEISLVREGAYAGTTAKLVPLVPLPLKDAIAMFHERRAAAKAAPAAPSARKVLGHA